MVAIGDFFFLFSQILLENALNQVFFFLFGRGNLFGDNLVFLHLFCLFVCLFVCLFEQSATYFHGLDGTINISKQILDTSPFYSLVCVASAHCPASSHIHFPVVLHVHTKQNVLSALQVDILC